MARNMVQFQKGLSMVEFLKKYVTDEACRKAVFSAALAQWFPLPGVRQFYLLRAQVAQGVPMSSLPSSNRR